MEKRNGAGSRLAGLLERPTQPDPAADVQADDSSGSAEPVEPKGRGVAPKKAKPPEPRAAKKIRGRTVYIPDDLFERVIVQSHRRDKTISEYVCMILERQVPDHRVIRAEPAEGDAG